MKTDYHMHSTYSVDGHHTPEELCDHAFQLRYGEIAITDHAEWQLGEGGLIDVVGYFDSIERCRCMYEPFGMRVLSGVELGNPHDFLEEVAALTQAYPFDVKIGSVHYVDGKNIHEPECFSNRGPYEVYAAYFAEVARMSATADFDMVGHFDRILWRASLMGLTFDPFQIEPIIRTALSTIVKRGQILELNLSTLATEPSWTTALITMLNWYRELGGHLVAINSDTHRLPQLGANFDLAFSILRAADLEPISSFSSIRPVTAVSV